MTYIFDIDGTICTNTDGFYEKAEPFINRIKFINLLFAQGHIIHYYTARGATTGIDWYELTQKQLDAWGAKYHKLTTKKPHYDVFVCDKAVNSQVFFND